MRARSTLLAVLGLTLLGAALRFPTLDRQSFWLDELVTVSLLDHGLGDVLREVPRSEATPFVYYVVAWAWGSLFGLGEVGIRTLSALAGTATIPVAYGAGAVLVSRRAGLVAAALVAVNPFLVWYSQEARSYALLALLGAGTVLAFGHALRGSGRWLAGWAVISALAIATHYYALFLVGAEVVWLLVRVRPSRPVALASLIPAATLVAHVRSCSSSATTAKQSPGRPSSCGSPGYRRTSSSATASRARFPAARSPRSSCSSGSRSSCGSRRSSAAARSSQARSPPS